MMITVTGAAGFIGSNMVAFLKKRGHTVRAVDLRKNPVNDYLYGKADEFVLADLRNPQKAHSVVKQSTMVFHFAANMGGVGFFHTYNFQPFIDNMRMDMNLIEGCQKHGVSRMFYSASACAYPTHVMGKEGKPVRLTEEQLIPANSDQMYGWEKLMMILLSKEAPVDVRVGIFDTIFGDNQEWEGERAKFPPTIVGKVIRAAQDKKPIQIWGNGKQMRSFLYISDAVEKMYEVMMADANYGPVNIASDETVTVQQCADWLCEFADITSRYDYDLSKPVGVVSRGISTEKFKKHFSYRDKVPTKEGFFRVYEYLKDKIH